MDKGERTNTIIAIVKRLIEWESAQAETALDVFGVYAGNYFDYEHETDFINRVLRNAGDDVLIELREYCARSQGDHTVESLDLPKCWTSDDLRIFISHSSIDNKLAHDLQNELELFGVKAFVAHSDIEPNDQWLKEIERALRTTDVLVCICTDDARQSFWVNQEIGWGLGRQIPIFNVHEKAAPFGFTAHIQALPSVSIDPAATAMKLVELLSNRDIYRKPVFGALTQALRRSRRYVHSIPIATILGGMAPWPSWVEKAISEATASNHNVRDSIVAQGIFKEHLVKSQHTDDEVISF